MGAIVTSSGSIERVVNTIEYYASEAGGRVAFNAATDYITMANSQASEPFAMFENPAASGVDVYMWFGEFASSADVRFRRMGGTTVSTRGTPRTTFNMGGGTTVGQGKLYVAGQFTVNTAAAVLRKQAFMRAYETYMTHINGVRIKPGGVLYWTVDGRGQDCSIYLEWYELPAVA